MDIYIPIPTKEEAGELWQEVETLRRNLDEVLKHPGEFVLIKGDDIIGYYKDFKACMEEGYRRFLNEVFMAQSVDAITNPIIHRLGARSFLPPKHFEAPPA